MHTTLASVLTTVNAPHSCKLDAEMLVACLRDPETAKKACGPVSSFFGDVAPEMQEAFAAAHGISKAALVSAAKAFAGWTGEKYPFAA